MNRSFYCGLLSVLIVLGGCTPSEKNQKTVKSVAITPNQKSNEGQGASRVPPHAVKTPTIRTDYAWQWTDFGEHSRNYPKAASDVLPKSLIDSLEGVTAKSKLSSVFYRSAHKSYYANLTPVLGVYIVDTGAVIYTALYNRRWPQTTVTAFDRKQNKALWSYKVKSYGAIPINEYHAAIQMNIKDNMLLIYGQEYVGRYIERVDLKKGTLIEQIKINDDVVESTWLDKHAYSELIEDKQKITIPAKSSGPDAMFELTASPSSKAEGGEYYTLLKRTTTDDVVWQKKLSRSFHEAAIMHQVGDTLIVCAHGRISSGARLMAYNATTGKALWSTHPMGVGSVSHSKYSNRVKLLTHRSNQYVILKGHESAANYIEVIDLKTGKTVSSVKYHP